MPFLNTQKNKKINLKYIYNFLIYHNKNIESLLLGDWGLGIGDWGLGIGDWEIGRASCRERV